MSLKGLRNFNQFNIALFIEPMRLIFVKAETWEERDGDTVTVLGSKVTLLIAKDDNDYGRDISNFGENLVIKVRGQAPDSFAKFKPLSTEVIIEEVERAVVWGDFSNQLSIIANVVQKS